MISRSIQQINNVAGDIDSAFRFARFEKETRYYSLILEQDLFEDWVITIINGRINTKLGRIRKLAFSNFFEAAAQFDAIMKMRVKRRYLLNSSSGLHN